MACRGTVLLFLLGTHGYNTYHGYYGSTMGTTMGPDVAQVWIQLSHENSVVTIVTNLNSLRSHVDWCNFCIHVRSLNVHHIGLVKATGLKITA
jgi:hypothetical protein